MKRLIIPALMILTFVITACSAISSPLPTQPQPDSVSTEPDSPEFDPATRMDDQGAIIFEVTPLNLDSATAESLEFSIVLTTHSIDLSMDLAATATLSTDTGISVNSALWDAPRGGHHVEGKLIFPAMQNGKSILDGATKLILTIANVDAPTRIFEWELR
ncbi:MAG: hypothetical protein HS100_16340 [Anaerolineales bacterium]|nr:hypothetical protein [Anaerolineales bacterium]MCB0103659.1 hypothetical protein [Anaerolineales bacterium]